MAQLYCYNPEIVGARDFSLINTDMKFLDIYEWNGALVLKGQSKKLLLLVLFGVVN